MNPSVRAEYGARISRAGTSISGNGSFGALQRESRENESDVGGGGVATEGFLRELLGELQVETVPLRAGRGLQVSFG